MTIPRAVIFDWGGTLTPWHTIDPVQMWRGYAEAYEPDRAAGLAEALASAENVAWGRARDHQRSGTLLEVLRAAGADPTSSRHPPALQAYERAWEPYTRLDPDAEPLLDRLRRAGLRLGVLSNTLWTRAFHEQVFARDGILQLFDGAVYSSEIPWTKPHPAAFTAALRAVGVDDPAAAVFVGDRLFDDIHGAGAAGLRTIHIPHSAIPPVQRGHTEGIPDATVDRLGEVFDVVAGWCGADTDPGPGGGPSSADGPVAARR